VYQKRQIEINDKVEVESSPSENSEKKVVVLMIDDEYDELEKEIIQSRDYLELLSILVKYNRSYSECFSSYL
jgi:hypothetical protein